MVVILLNRGADANTPGVNERPPLHEALGQSQPERERDVIMTLKMANIKGQLYGLLPCHELYVIGRRIV